MAGLLAAVENGHKPTPAEIAREIAQMSDVGLNTAGHEHDRNHHASFGATSVEEFLGKLLPILEKRAWRRGFDSVVMMGDAELEMNKLRATA